MYTLMNKYGLISAVLITVLLLGVAALIYNSETYVIKDSGEYVEFEKEMADYEQQLLEEDKAEMKAKESMGGKITDDVKKQFEKRRESRLEAYAAEVETVGQLSGEMMIAYVLIGLAAVISLFFPLVNSILYNPKALIKVGAGIVVLGIVFLIGYNLSSETSEVAEKMEVTSLEVQLSGAFLNTTWIMMGLALLGIIYNEVSKIFK